MSIPNRTVTLSMVNDYPFSISNQYGHARTVIQVRKILEYHMQPQHIVHQKLRMLKILGSHQLIELTNTVQQDHRISLIYEYVHKKLDNDIWNMEFTSVQKIRIQMKELAHKLAFQGVNHDMRFDNVGIGNEGNLKYFLGLNFRIDKSSNKSDLEKKYLIKIEEMFGEGGRFARAFSSTRKTKKQFAETMDSNKYQNEHPLGSSKPNSRIAMKRSATVTQQRDFLTVQNLPQKRLLQSVAFQRPCQNQQVTNQIKMVKIEDIGQRINRLREYVKGLTGVSPKNNTGYRQLIVKMDDTCHNKIMEENKLYISPNYTKLEKKIAEWRESKFYRAYGEKEILYNKNNQGYQININQKIKNPNITQRKNELESEKTQQTHKLLMNSQRSSFNKNPDYLQVKKRTSISDKDKSYEKSFNSSKGKKENFNQSSYENQYHKLGHTDKYCEQFMVLLEDDNPGTLEDGQCSPMLHKLIGQIGRQARESETKETNREPQQTGKQIKNRVNKAIRNSLKLIKGLKSREH